MKNRFLPIMIAVMILMTFIPLYGMQALADGGAAPEDWAAALYDKDSGLSFTKVSGGGNLYIGGGYTVTIDSTEHPMSGALILSTASGCGSDILTMRGDGYVSSMLTGLSGYNFGGHLSYVEVETVVLGKTLSFNYAFASSEFDQYAQYNDSFGLFVSIKDRSTGEWSDYRNIAIIPGTEMAVSIQNLKTVSQWSPSGSLSCPSADVNGKSGSGYTPIMTARISDLVIGSSIRVLFAICDITDAGYDSAVVIEAGSFRFSILDFENERMHDLDPSSDYIIALEDGTEITVTADDEGTIPLEFTKDGKDYSLIGGKVSIRLAGSADAVPIEFGIKGRPDAPEAVKGPSDTQCPSDITVPEVRTDKTSITVTAPVSGQEYSIDGGNTWISYTGKETVSFKGLTPGAEYELITRKSATDTDFASLNSEPLKITTMPMLGDCTVEETDYTGIYDGLGHMITVTVEEIEDATLSFTDDPDEEYDPALTFTDAGEYDVYFKVEKDGYVPVYGTGKVTIAPKEVTVSGITAVDRDFRNGELSVETDLSGMVIDGLIDGDDLSVTVNAVMENDGSGENKPVALTDMALTGTSAANYVLAETGNQTETTVNIAPPPATGVPYRVPLCTALMLAAFVLLAVIGRKTAPTE